MEIYRCLSARDGQLPWTAGGSDNIDYEGFKRAATGVGWLGFPLPEVAQCPDELLLHLSVQMPETPLAAKSVDNIFTWGNLWGRPANVPEVAL